MRVHTCTACGIVLDRDTADDNGELWLTDQLQRKLQILDAQLLAVIKEQDLDITNSEDLVSRVTDLFKDSMIFLQLNDESVVTYISQIEAVSLIVQRIQYVIRLYKIKQRLDSYYSMALSLNGCTMIEKSKQELMDYIQEAESYVDWPAENRAEYIINLCIKFSMPIDDVGKDSDGEEPEDCWSQVLKPWLMGENAAEIAINMELPIEWGQSRTMRVSTLIDELCEFRLPWGLNALSMFWKTLDTLQEDLNGETTEVVSFQPPEVVAYFASMLRFGVHEPVATVALAMGLGNREAALALAILYNIGSLDAPSILSCLQTLKAQNVIDGIEDVNLRDILVEFISLLSYKLNNLDFDIDFSRRQSTLIVESYLQHEYLGENMRLVYQIENNLLHLLTQDFDYIGTKEIEESKLLKDLQAENVIITIEQIEHRDNEEIYLILSVKKTTSTASRVLESLSCFHKRLLGLSVYF